MRWNEEAATEAVRSEWGIRHGETARRAAVFEVYQRADGKFLIALPYDGPAPAGTRLRVVGRSAAQAIARALREIECRGSGEFFRDF